MDSRPAGWLKAKTQQTTKQQQNNNNSSSKYDHQYGPHICVPISFVQFARPDLPGMLFSLTLMASNRINNSDGLLCR